MAPPPEALPRRLQVLTDVTQLCLGVSRLLFVWRVCFSAYLSNSDLQILTGVAQFYLRDARQAAASPTGSPQAPLGEDFGSEPS